MASAVKAAPGIWGDAVKYKKVCKKLLSLQRGFAVKTIRGFRTVSTIASITLAQFTPLDLKVQEVCTVERAKLTGCSPYLSSDIKLHKRTPPTKLAHPATRQGIQFSSAYVQNDIDRLCPPDSTKIFTDGSKLENGDVGAAFVIYKPNDAPIIQKLKLHNSCTVFQAELLAIERAVRWVQDSNIENVAIFSDSLSALQELENKNTTNSLATKTHDHLRSHSGNVKFVWVKAHVGLEGNEAADEAAKSAATSHQSLDFAKFPISHVKRLSREANRLCSEERYTSSTTGVRTRTWLPSLDSVTKLYAIVKQSFHLTQVLTGHGYHRQYLHRFKIVATDKCNCDPNTVQDIDHLLKVCPRYARQRETHIALCNHLDVSPFDIPEMTETFCIM
ncbi:uncharacterized protein LOC114353665 [Ostrinia furnacalis]|uniref:uncharacterized protein LOC114353665 n=1 Tax=Ostrinia furnacalis TaxID=93504 RepID=UPI001038A64D|nr:uncharacterized protein LOC114353665 [Ostrinia furnacalis]